MNNTQNHRNHNKNHRNHTTASSSRRISSTQSSRKATSSRSRRRKQKRSANLFKKVLLLISCVIIFTIMFSLITSKSSASSVVHAEEHLSELEFELVEIQPGDTLWSIAEDHMTPGFHDIRDYIDAIKTCNQLDTDQINYGNYLLIPYYDVLEGDAESF